MYRKALLRFFHKQLQLILVTEYPKSGASWLCQMLAHQTGKDFPRQRFPSLKPSIMHGHYLTKAVTGPTVVFWRDPRDIMVSWYFHSLVKSDKNNHKLVDSIGAELDFDDIGDVRNNLPLFIEYTFTRSTSPRFSLNQFVDNWHGRTDVVHSYYEGLQLDGVSELVRVFGELGLDSDEGPGIKELLDAYSFERQSNRKRGTENTASYLRKGIVGDWVNHFSDEAADVLNTQMEGRLKLLGYV